MQIRLEAKIYGQYLTGTSRKHEKDDFLVIPLKHVSGLRVTVITVESQILWAIAHENGRP